MVLLKRGITGFFNWNLRETLPEVNFKEFKQACYFCARHAGYKSLSCTPKNVTPNFHYCLIQKNNETIGVLCNSIYPLIAFCNPLNENSCAIHFVDNLILQDAFSASTKFIVAKASELLSNPSDEHLLLLDPCEREQIEYWQPVTVGEIIFNWWD